MSDKAKRILVISLSTITLLLIVALVLLSSQNKKLKRDLENAKKVSAQTVTPVIVLPSPTQTLSRGSATPTVSVSVTSTPTKSDEELIKEALAAKFGILVTDVTIKIETRSESAAYGTVYFTDSGGWFVASKSGDAWKIVESGNGTIDCKMLDDNNIPSSVVSECYDSSTDQVKTR